MTVILITGAARGIGHELARRALARGDTVFAGVRREADAARFGANPNLHPIVIDVADTASVSNAFAEVDRRLAGRPLDAVVNVAGIALPNATEVAPVAEFEQTFNTNALGSVRVARA